MSVERKTIADFYIEMLYREQAKVEFASRLHRLRCMYLKARELWEDKNDGRTEED